MYRKRYNMHAPERIFQGLMLMMLLSLLQPMNSLAGSPQKGLVRSGVMEIEGKTDHSIVVSERTFSVIEATSVFDESGKRINLDDLAVPCTAKIEYQLRMDSSPLCLKIQVKELRSSSRRDWSSSDYERTK